MHLGAGVKKKEMLHFGNGRWKSHPRMVLPSGDRSSDDERGPWFLRCGGLLP
jgi:hypothetical protein